MSDRSESLTHSAQASVLYFLSDAYLNAPRTDVIESLRSEGALDSWPLDRSHPDTAAGLERLARHNAEWSPDQIGRLEDDFTRLFIGIGKVLAPPYESVYLSEDHLLFERETLAVREWYRRYGLRVPQLNVLPDDHIGYELFFLARLKARAASLLEDGDSEGAAAIIDESYRFVATHLNRWVGLFASRILEHSQTGYYAAIGLLTKSVVEQLQ